MLYIYVGHILGTYTQPLKLYVIHFVTHELASVLIKSVNYTFLHRYYNVNEKNKIGHSMKKMHSY